MSNTDFQERFDEALNAANIVIVDFLPQKPRPVRTNHGTVSLQKLGELLRLNLGKEAFGKFADVAEASLDRDTVREVIEGIVLSRREELGADHAMPVDLKGLTLNLDLASKKKESRFFLTNADDSISRISGDTYLLLTGTKEMDAALSARKVITEYMPRKPIGVAKVILPDSGGQEMNVLNTYSRPTWVHIDKPIKQKLPPLVSQLVEHLFPLAKEREFFWCWVYASLFKRAPTYLVLCGNPGTGKNRLKLLLRALHGHLNTVDGKRSTFTEKFNSQLSNCTLVWFDELHYDLQMENVMKEVQNDSISTERKGVDATRSTPVYASFVVSNNKPRDNYIAFDARKFVPLQLNTERLETSMTSDDIAELTRKVEKQDSPEFDPEFVASVAYWVEEFGKKHEGKWPNLEYKGPMFYRLATTSMSRWQKGAANYFLTEATGTPQSPPDAERGFLWSKIEKLVRAKSEKGIIWPDFTTVQNFFDFFRDRKGREIFKTEEVPESLSGDFWVKVVATTKIIKEELKVLNDGKEEEDYSDSDLL